MRRHHEHCNQAEEGFTPQSDHCSVMGQQLPAPRRLAPAARLPGLAAAEIRCRARVTGSLVPDCRLLHSHRHVTIEEAPLQVGSAGAGVSGSVSSLLEKALLSIMLFPNAASLFCIENHEAAAWPSCLIDASACNRWTYFKCVQMSATWLSHIFICSFRSYAHSWQPAALQGALPSARSCIVNTASATFGADLRLNASQAGNNDEELTTGCRMKPASCCGSDCAGEDRACRRRR